MTYRVALAGAGMVSKHHLIGWQAATGAKVVAIADPNRNAAESRAAEFGIDHVYSDPDQMLRESRPDILDIASPVATHGTLLKLGTDHGLVAILCQKPLAETLSGASGIAQGLRASPTRVMVHENWRFRPHYARIRNWIDAGLIGTPVQFAMNVFSSGLCDTDEAPPPALLRQPFMAKMERLIVLEVLVHHIDTLRMLFGPLSVRSAALSRVSKHVAGEDTASILFGSPNIFGTLNASLAAKGYPSRPEDALRIVGTEGVIRLSGNTLTLNGPQDESITLDREADYQASYNGVIEHFVTALRNAKPFATPPETHLEVLGLVDDIYARSNRT